MALPLLRWNQFQDKYNKLLEAAGDLLPVYTNWQQQLVSFGNLLLHPDSINDRDLLLENIVVLMACLGNDNREPKMQQFSNELQHFTILLLYKDLPHPPATYLRLPPISVPPSPLNNVTYAFRTADGSYYNPLLPALGKAGSPYARSVPALNPVPSASLPDSGLLFDTLLARDKFEGHPGGLSSTFFALADLVIHTLFNTSSDGYNNNTSSYVDLSILYGNSDAQLDSVRGEKDGTGSILPDTFADPRLLMMPPAACALLVLLSRNHNFIAQRILEINEFRNYKSQFKTDEERLAQDDEIFHRARLVNCGFMMQVILRDYVGAILGLARDGYTWRLDPLAEARELSHELSPRGEGNVVSVEFNLLYRWHSCLSQRDTEWTENELSQILGEDPSKATPQEFVRKAVPYFTPSKSPQEYVFGGLKRNRDGRFSDADLAKLILDSTGARAASFKARGIPKALRVIEIMSIERARKWGVCTLNEFRKFLGLKPYETFEKWNGNAEIADTAKKLYKHIDNLELYVGLQAEEAKKPGGGAGLCPGYTISRAILADAVCLTRGDRFLTVDFTPYNLTSWGYLYCQCDPNDGSYGGMVTKMLLQLLPDYFPIRSAYTHFPLLDPQWFESEMKKKHPEKAAIYDWKRPSIVSRAPIVLNTFETVKEVLTDPHMYSSGYDGRLSAIVRGNMPHYIADVSKIIMHQVDTWAAYFVRSTRELIHGRCCECPGTNQRTLDVVHDVINLLPVRWIVHELAGLPDDEYKWRTLFADVGQYLFINVDSADEWALRERSVQTFDEFTEVVTKHLGRIGSVLGASSKLLEVNPNARGFLKKLREEVKHGGHRGLAASLFTEIVPSAAYFSQAIALALNYYLSADRRNAREDIINLAKEDTTEAYKKIQMLIREALYADPPVSALYRTVVQDGTLKDSRRVRSGDVVFASITEANREGGILPVGEHGLVDAAFFDTVAPRVLGVLVTEMKDVEIVKGFNQFTEQVLGVTQRSFIDKKGYVKPWADSLTVKFTC